MGTLISIPFLPANNKPHKKSPRFFYKKVPRGADFLTVFVQKVHEKGYFQIVVKNKKHFHFVKGSLFFNKCSLLVHLMPKNN